MKIVICRITTCDNNQPFVQFKSDCGQAEAIWRGSIFPSLKTYDVEFTLPELLLWGDTIQESAESADRIWQEADFIFIQGLYEMLDENGIVTIRINNSIIDIETSGNPVLLGARVCLKVHKDNLELYPYSL
jgi:hypothetical protein